MSDASSISSSVRDRLKKFEENSQNNEHFSSVKGAKNNLVDMVSRESLKIKIDFEAVDRKYGLSDDEDDIVSRASSLPVVSEHSTMSIKPEAKMRKSTGDAPQHTGPYLPAPEGTPKPGDSLKVEPLGSLEYDFSKIYELGTVINSGAFGTVYRGHHIMTGPKAEVAIKVVDREACNDEVSDEEVMGETEVMRKLVEFEHIIRLFDFYMDDEKFYIVLELAAGGDVFDRLAERKTYNESDARDLCKLLLETIYTLHEQKLLHRDLKPENLLLKTTKDDTGILLCDFGFAKYLPQGGGSLSTHCGTPEYASPEIVNGEEYKAEVDMWAIGCIIYMLLCGIHPFASDTDDSGVIYDLVAAGDWGFGYNDEEKAVWSKISAEAKDLITHLFDMDGKKRYSAFEAINSKWFTDCAKFKLKKTKLEGVAIKNITKYNTTKKPKYGFVDKNYTGEGDCLYRGPTKEEIARLKKLRAIAMYRPAGDHLA